MNLYFKTNQEQILWISKIQFQKTIRNCLTVYVSPPPPSKGEKKRNGENKNVKLPSAFPKSLYTP